MDTFTDPDPAEQRFQIAALRYPDCLHFNPSWLPTPVAK